MKLIDAGFGNYVNADRVITIVSPESLPVRRLVQDAKNAGRTIDVSCGKKTRSVIITDSDHIILSADEASELIARVEDSEKQ